MSRLTFFLAFILLTAHVTAEDILIADFEGETYPAGWAVEGTAFGPGPARGTLANQMPVTGFLGERLVNTYFEGDDTVGKLTSPAFKIERNYLSFLLGGGGHPGLEVNLRVDGKTVRTATGPNTVPGGNEALSWHDWDVAEFAGKDAVLEIVDDARGGWGHINVDQITLGNFKKEPKDLTQEFKIATKYLHIPVCMASPETWVRVEVDGVWQQEFKVPLPVAGEKPDFYGNLYVAPFKGKTVTLIAERVPAGAEPLNLVKPSDEMAQEATVYTESRRPQFHFTTRTGWINDPNGLVHYDGVWHLFYQHNPYSTRWGNMTWGHATSPDLLCWTEQPTAIHPDKLGTIFSGSGVVDWKNTSGLQKPGSDTPPLVFFYTYDGDTARFGAPVTQGMAYSLDGGRTFQKYDKNPVLPHVRAANRDPKVIWHAPSGQWIMALYMDGEDYSLFGSKDLKSWEKLCDINNIGCGECPDFFPLAVDGNAENVKWVFWGGNGKYLIGSFDGREFKPETPPLTNKYNGANDYAAMTFSDAPDGRRIQISWMATWGDTERVFAGMPFNGQFTIPRELTLRTTPAGPRLFMMPVKEVETLRVESPGDPAAESNPGLVDIEIIIKVSDRTRVAFPFHLQNIKIEYDAIKKTISLDDIHAPLEVRGGELRLRILLDRTSIELFAQDGEVQIAKCFPPVKYDPQIPRPEQGINITKGNNVHVETRIWNLKPVWGK